MIISVKIRACRRQYLGPCLSVCPKIFRQNKNQLWTDRQFKTLALARVFHQTLALARVWYGAVSSQGAPTLALARVGCRRRKHDNKRCCSLF